MGPKRLPAFFRLKLLSTRPLQTKKHQGSRAHPKHTVAAVQQKRERHAWRHLRQHVDQTVSTAEGTARIRTALYMSVTRAAHSVQMYGTRPPPRRRAREVVRRRQIIREVVETDRTLVLRGPRGHGLSLRGGGRPPSGQPTPEAVSLSEVHQSLAGYPSLASAGATRS